jgi:uncharacterized membrane protein YgcG
MKALAPLLMIGLSLFSKGAAMPMLSAYAGYQNAVNKRQEEDAKLARTHFQDQRKETLARMSMEQMEAAGVLDDPAGLIQVALKYQDPQLLALAQQGDTKGAEALFQRRDKLSMDLGKTQASDLREREFEATLAWRQYQMARDDRNDAEKAAKSGPELELLKAREAAAKKKADDAKKAAEEDRAAGYTGGQPDTSGEGGGEGGGGGSGGGGQGDGAGTSGSDGDGTPGRQSAATPSAPAATPAAAPVPPTQAAEAPTGGEDQVVDAQGQPTPTRSDVRPAAFSGSPFAGPPSGEPPAPGAAPAAPPAAAPTADPNGPIPTPGIEPGSAADGEVSGLMTGGAISDIPKRNQQRALTAAGWRRAKLNDLARLSPASGDEFNRQIARLDPGVAELIDRIQRNKAGIPSQGTGGRLQAYDQMLQKLASKQNPHWDPSMWKSKQDVRDDFMKGWRSRTIYRANNIPEAATNVLAALNKVQAKYPNDTDFGSHLDAALAHATGTYKEYAGLAAALRQFAMESTSTVSMGQPAVTLVNNLLQSAMPVGENPAGIREALKIDISNVSKGLDSLKYEWAHNFDDGMESAGYIPENDQILKTIRHSLDSDSGQFIDKDGKPVTDLPGDLQSAVPQAAPATPPAASGAPQAPEMSQQQYDKAPSGTHYRMPDDPPGSYRTKP